MIAFSALTPGTILPLSHLQRQWPIWVANDDNAPLWHESHRKQLRKAAFAFEQHRHQQLLIQQNAEAQQLAAAAKHTE